MMPIEEERQFQDLLQVIQQKKGLDCRQYKVSYLKRRLAVRMRATRMMTYAEYKIYLQVHAEEYDILLDRLTINVSNFFRDPSAYTQIQNLIFPKWEKATDVRIWSAGCANGEEPYSLAMLCKTGLPKQLRWEILATDIDPTVIQNAQQGRYKNDYLKTLPQLWKLENFEPVENGAFWEANQELKKKIRFQVQDLTGRLPEQQFDMIVCRNVMIYFIAELQDRLFRSFWERLKKDGYLILGKTETMLGEMREHYTSIDLRERIYQKKLIT